MANVKPAPSPAERCATCGHGANDHHFSSRDDQYWCDKCSGNSWMHPFDYAPPPVEAASEVPAFNKSADSTHVEGTEMHTEATSGVLTRDDYVDTVRHECDSVGSCGVLLAHDAALREALAAKT